MSGSLRVSVVIPARNEEAAIGRVLAEIPEWVTETIVVDNGSTDATAARAAEAGARVVHQPEPGYGAACLAGIAALDRPDIVVFLDGDRSDYPEEMGALIEPIADGAADLVIGSRVLGRREPGALAPQARFGNWLACRLIRAFWGTRYTDLGPFRAIRAGSLARLGMRDRTYGWTVEMQIKALQQGLRVREVPVRYRRRIGRSKVSGTVRGVIGAGSVILLTIFRAALTDRRRRNTAERLIVFTRYPEPGTTKTRLIPALGAAGAADLQRRMTEATLAWARRLGERRRVAVEVRYEGGDEPRLREWLGDGPAYLDQGEGDLGRRLRRAFDEAFAAGAARVVIVGCDCPALDDVLARRAFEALQAHDLVLGPASDGGYYLIGLRRPSPALFENIPWGGPEVLAQTLPAAERAGLAVQRLARLDDVDRPEDLTRAHLRATLSSKFGRWARRCGVSVKRAARRYGYPSAEVLPHQAEVDQQGDGDERPDEVP